MRGCGNPACRVCVDPRTDGARTLLTWATFICAVGILAWGTIALIFMVRS